MKLILKFSLFLFSISNSFLLYSQVTITEIEKIDEKIVLKPEPYDSLENWKKFERLPEYKKYIGLKIYLAPFENPKIGYGGSNFQSFLFSPKPNLIKIDTTIEQLRLRKYWQTQEGSINNRKNYDSIQITNILTLTYCPFHFYSKYERDPFESTMFPNEEEYLGTIKIANSNIIGDKYFTIIDILYGDTLDNLKNQLYKQIASKDSEVKSSFEKYFRYAYKDIREKPLNILVQTKNRFPESDVLFVIKNENNNDTVYCFNYNKFILVPYFTKQKQMYEGKYLVRESNDYYYEENSNEAFDYRYVEKYEDKEGNIVSSYKKIKIELNSKWLCSEVTLLKPTYTLSYILKNDKDEQITLFNLNRFILEKDNIKKEADKKLQQQQLIANKKRDELLKNEKEKKDFENRKTEYISKFGQQYGELIANYKVKIGMTSEMCKYAWGLPIWTNKITSENGTIEVWHCGSGYKLYFTNNILKIIEE